MRPMTSCLAAWAPAILMSVALGVPVFAQDATADTPAPAPTRVPFAAPCIPDFRPLEPGFLRLNGAWQADDGGVYYIRHVGERVWWSGMSERFGPASELGREWSNVAAGTVEADGTIILEWADVPRGAVLGGGTMTLKVAGAIGVGLVKVSETGSGFGANVWTPCRAEPIDFPDFGHPFSVTDTLGIGLRGSTVDPSLALIIPASVMDSGMSVWVVGPAAGEVCSSPAGGRPLEPGSEAFIDYLRAIPELSVDQPTPTSVDGLPAISIDVTTTAGAQGCGSPGQLPLWRASEVAAIRLGGTSRIVALELGGDTVVFEIWGGQPDDWLAESERVLPLIDFEGDGG